VSGEEASAGAGTTGDDVGASETTSAPPLRGVRALTGEDFSFADAIGGARGLVESTLPGLVFVVVYLLTRRLTVALVAASAVAVLAVVLRLVQRTPMTQAFSGLLGVGVGVLWAWWSGRAQDYFVGGLILNAAWFIGIVISLAVRWPAVGVLVSLVRGQDMVWRTDPDLGHLRRRYVWASWLWVVMFGLRLAVQVPLYLRGAAAIGWLGTARLAMGVPLFALTLWLTWLLVGSRAALADRPGQRPTPQR